MLSLLGQESIATVVGGLGYFLSSLFDSQSEHRFMSDDKELRRGNWSVQSTGMNANQHMYLGENNAWSINSNTTWNNPMPDMLEQVRELAFRVAVQTAIDNPSEDFAQNVRYSGSRDTISYRSDFDIMGVTISLNLVALFSLFPLYYGWWELGRKSSLGVLETAKAFGAPLMDDIDDSATEKQILQRIGKKRVVYGQTAVSGRSPSSAAEFLLPRKELRSRLQIVDEGEAKKPRTGISFGAA